MKDKEEYLKRLRNAFFAVAALLLLSAIGASAYNTGRMLNKVSIEPDPILQTRPLKLEQSNALSVTETSERSSRSATINILLIGQDRRPGQKKRARSDAMILCTVNQSTKTVTLTSFMRDMYVQIPGKKSNRINAAYALGGTNLLNRCIDHNFGVTVDGNVVVDFAAFMDAIDLAGGVDVELTAKEAAYLNSVTYKDQQHWETGLEEGVNHLDGNRALAYARIRKLSGNDFGRTQRQRKVLSALFEKISKLTLPEIYRLFKGLSEQISTDMTKGQLIGYAMELLPDIKNFQIETQQIPAAGTYRSATIDGMQVLVPDLEKNAEILSKIVS